MQIKGTYDVVVVGGGTSGVAAAIAAARTGANTLLIERVGALGGQMNVSGPPGFAYANLYNERQERIIGGIITETHERLLKETCVGPLAQISRAAADCQAPSDCLRRR